MINVAAQLWMAARNSDGPLYVPTGSSITLLGNFKSPGSSQVFENIL